MPLNPSRRDTIGPPPRDVSDLASITRHHGSALKSVEPGLLDGRWATTRPVLQGGGSQLVGEDGGGDGIERLWEDGDRLIVTSSGTQTFRLTYEPVEESLVIRWHPDGKGPLTQVSERWILDGQTVTIPDSDGDIEAGDLFSAQYEYEPTESVDGPLVLIGTGAVYDTNPTLALPAGSQVGDFIVITTITGTIADGRVSLLADHDGTGLAHFYNYAGTLSSLGGFATSGGSVLATWAVFRAPSIASAPTAVIGAGSSPTAMPQVSTRHGIFIGGVRGGLTDATLDIPTGWTAAVGNGLLVHARQSIAYWDAAAEESSPSAPMTGIYDDYLVNVLGMSNAGVDEGEGG